MKTIIAALLAACAILSAPAYARDCGPTLKPGPEYKGQIEMPPPQYWVKPGRDYKTVSCETLTELYGDTTNADCHLFGRYLTEDAAAIDIVRWMAFGLNPGDVLICGGISGVSKTMVLIHEYAHRAGWQHGQHSRRYTVNAWMADPRVPDWAKK